MFRRREPRSDDAAGDGSNEPFTYLHAGTTVRGSLEANGRVRIHGTVEGDVRVEGVLEVAEGGVIAGSIVEADEVRVLGTVHANVTARERMEIWKDGRVEGDISAAVLDIEEGATFVGRSLMSGAARPGLPAGEHDDSGTLPTEAAGAGFDRDERGTEAAPPAEPAPE